MVDRRIPLVQRELSELSKEKTFLVAIIIQLVIASVSSFLVFGFVSLYDPSAGANQETVDFAVSGNASEEVLEIINNDGEVTATTTDSLEESLQVYEKGRVSGVIHIDKNKNGTFATTIIAPSDGFTSGLVVSKGKMITQELQEETRQEITENLKYKPLDSLRNSTTTPYFEFTYTVLIPVLLFLPIFITGALIADSLSQENRENTLPLLQATPVSDAQIFDSKLFAGVILAPFQVLLWTVLLYLNGITVYSIAELLVLVTSAATIVGLLGTIVAQQFDGRSKVQLTYSVGLLALFSFTLLLPEHPINTVAKLSIGRPTELSYILLGLYTLLAIGLYTVTRKYISHNGFETTNSK